jgi:uncharacterized protein (DUF58 family)
VNVFPDARLVRLWTLWVTVAVIAVAWPALLAPLGAGAVLLVLATLLDAWALLRQPVVRFERILPRQALVGCDSEIVLRVTNPAGRPIRLGVSDEWPADLAAQAPRFEDAVVPVGGTLDLRCGIRPRRSGDHPLGRVLLSWPGPLGLLRRRLLGDPGALVPVYPDARRLLRTAALRPRRLLGHAGSRPIRRRGGGSEFESLRDYVIGDDPRHVDWSATARRGRLVTRLYQHERNYTLVLAVDTSRLMGTLCADERSKLDHAVDAALALAVAALARGDRTEVMLFDREIHGHVVPRVQRGEIGPIVELLRCSQPRDVEADFQRLAAALLARRRGRALVVVLTDFTDAASAGIEAPLKSLRRHYRTLLVALRDPFYSRIAPGAAGDTSLQDRLVIDELLRDREAALARLRGAAVQTVDLPPEQVVAPLLDRYLEFRYFAG